MSEPGIFDVRPFEPADQASVLFLAAEILCREFHVLDDLEDEVDLHGVATVYRAPDNIFLVALRDGKLVAAGGVVRISEGDCEVRRLLVDAAYRREGIASRLVAQLIDFVRQRNYRRVLLERRPEIPYSDEDYARYGLFPVPETESLPRPGRFMAMVLQSATEGD